MTKQFDSDKAAMDTCAWYMFSDGILQHKWVNLRHQVQRDINNGVVLTLWP